MREDVWGWRDGLAVASMGAAMCGYFLFLGGLQMGHVALTVIGGLCLATPGALAWVLRNPDAPKPTRPARKPSAAVAPMTDQEFDRLVDEVERQARALARPARPVAGAPVDADDEFGRVVRAALDELPGFVQDELERGNLAVRISDYGCEWDAYGLYCGATAADDDCNHLITVFRDTLMAQYGDDPDELHRQVRRTVRHEVAHHFGFDERRVRALGL